MIIEYKTLGVKHQITNEVAAVHQHIVMFLLIENSVAWQPTKLIC